MFPTHPRDCLNPGFTRPPWSYRRLYHRSSFDDYWERSWGINKATVAMSFTIFICCAVFMNQVIAVKEVEQGNRTRQDWIEQNLISSTENVRQGRWWVMLGSSFAHGNLLHLGINMWALWSVGNGFVSVFGFRRFAVMWAFSAVASSAAQLYWQDTKQRFEMELKRWDHNQKYTILGIPISKERARVIAGAGDSQYGGSVGASGVTCGLIGLYLFFAPMTSVTLLHVINSPIWLSEIVFLGGSAYCLATGLLPIIAHAAHLGGTAAGVAYYYGVARPYIRNIARRL